MSFSSTLLHWYKEHKRDLPWRGISDPYIIWLSEIILQQTRIDQGMPYFYRFLERFPTIQDFAAADVDEVLRLWQGLGYYSRARNMYAAAQQVMGEFGGIFPSRYEDLLTLKGVGEYTAAAVSSFSTNQPKAVLDGNVFRVLSRYFGIETPINTGAGKKEFAQLAFEVLNKQNAGEYNQAIMDFGATQCKPKNPDCGVCVFQRGCYAVREGKVGILPVKLKARASRNRYFHYFIIREDKQILMSRRDNSEVWGSLYEFPLLETSGNVDLPELVESPEFRELFLTSDLVQVGPMVKHVLSHQNIYAKFYEIRQSSSLRFQNSNWDYFLSEEIDKLAKHKLIFSFLEKYDILH